MTRLQGFMPWVYIYEQIKCRLLSTKVYIVTSCWCGCKSLECLRHASVFLCLLRKLLFRYYLMIFKCALAIWLCSLTAEVCDVPCTGEVELIVKTGDCLTFFGIHQVAKNFKFAMLTL